MDNNIKIPVPIEEHIKNKFTCQKCGKCCKVFGVNEYTNAPRALILYKWEKDKLIELAKKHNKKIDVSPLMFFFDEKTQTNVVITYQFNMENVKKCPFLFANHCMIYEDRPLVCKAFPLTYINIDPPSINFAVYICKEAERIMNSNSDLSYSTLCLKENLGEEMILNSLALHQGGYESLFKDALELDKEGKIKLMNVLQEKVDYYLENYPIKDYLEFLEEYKLETKEQIAVWHCMISDSRGFQSMINDYEKECKK